LLVVTAEVLRANTGSQSAISLNGGRLTQNFMKKRSLPSTILLRKLG